MSKKISELDVVSAVDGADLLAIVQGGVTKKVAIDQLPFGDAEDMDTTSVLTPASGTVTVDLSLGDYFTLLLSAHVTTLAFANGPGAGKGASKLIRVTQDNTDREITWPASFKWPLGVPGVISTGNGSVDVLAISTFNGGSVWYATLAKAFS